MRDRPSPIITAASITGSSGIEPLFSAKHQSPSALRSRQSDDRNPRGGLDVGTQRHHVIRHPRPEDRQATLRDELVEGPLDHLVGPVGQAHHIAGDEFDRPVDQSRGKGFIHHQPQRGDAVVVGVAGRRIVVEQADFQGATEPYARTSSAIAATYSMEVEAHRATANSHPPKMVVYEKCKANFRHVSFSERGSHPEETE